MCTQLVCDVAPYCCDTAWDTDCIAEAIVLCDVCGTTSEDCSNIDQGNSIPSNPMRCHGQLCDSHSDCPTGQPCADISGFFALRF